MARSISNNRLESLLRTGPNKRVEFRVAMSTSVMLSSYVTIPLGSRGGSQETVRRELVRLMATLVGMEGSAWTWNYRLPLTTVETKCGGKEVDVSPQELVWRKRKVYLTSAGFELVRGDLCMQH